MARPVGLAAAAHLLERGREALVLESGDAPAAAVAEWGHVRLFSPWPELTDAASRRRLEATGWSAPSEGYPTGAQWIERYLAPLAATLGEVEGKRYEKMLLTMFFGIFAFNITGVIPGLNIASTGLIGISMVLAATTWVVYVANGIRKHGAGGYVKHSLFPPGVPGALKPLIAIIDFLQVLIIRPATLALRLTINMIVGHLLLVLTYSATTYFWYQAPSGFNLAYGVLTFIGILFITLLEVFVATLQAFIFAILSAVYIKMAIREDH